MPKMKLNDTELFYSDDGTGNPILFIHGLGASHSMFEPQVSSFKGTYRVICPDTRGNGNSGKLTGPVSTVLDNQCDDISVLMDKLGIEKAVFCGISYGGVFCQHFALRHPTSVAGMVVSDSFGDTRIRNIQDAFLMTTLYASLWVYFFPKMLLPSVKWQYKQWPLAQKHMVEAFQNLRSYEVFLQRLAINMANHTKVLNTLKIPVLGIVGDTSKILIRYMNTVMDAIPNAKLEIIHDSFDPSNLCQPETFDRLVKRYLVDINW